MPTSQKPRKPKAAKPADLALDRWLTQIDDAMQDGDLDAFDTAHAALADLASQNPTIEPGLLGDLDLMRAEMVEVLANQALVDAALWAGDLDRAERLETELFGPPEDAEDDENDPDLLPDPYADLVAGRPGAVDTLLASGADLNLHLGTVPRPALFAALEAPNRSANTIQRLISAGANPLDLTEDSGDSALVWALLSTHMSTYDPASEGQLFTLLLQSGADPDEGCGEFGALLNRAIIMGLPTHVAALLEAGANPDVPTPFDFAIYDLAYAPSLVLAAPKPAVVALLLAAGANPVALGAFGQTPLDYITAAAAEARTMQSADDAWTVRHAAALSQSAALLQTHTTHRPARPN
jgi:ankyrin repeat protein